MIINQELACSIHCKDVVVIKHFAKINCNHKKIKLILISEALPENIKDYFYEKGLPSFIQTTNQVFRDAGFKFNTYEDYLVNGIYLTTAIKCRKKDYLVSSDTIKNCSVILQEEIEQFPNVHVIMLMGDFAIKSLNYIWKNKYGKKVIPPGSTYKIRNNKYANQGIRFFPSYTQTGDSFNIEKSKRRMITEDIKNAMKLIL